MRRTLTPEEVMYLIDEEGFTKDEVEKGFGIFSSPDIMNGALHIERYDMINMYDGDGDAAEVAEKEYDIDIIKDLPEDELSDMDIAYFIDDEENVQLIKEYLLKEYNIKWRE